MNFQLVPSSVTLDDLERRNIPMYVHGLPCCAQKLHQIVFLIVTRLSVLSQKR